MKNLFSQKSIRGILVMLFFVLIFSSALKNSFAYLDPDLGWHLSAGQEVALSGAVPNINNYNYTIDQLPWVDHEWLSDYISFLVVDHFGYIVLSVFFALLTTLIIFLIYLYAKRRRDIIQPRSAIFAIIFLGFWASLPHFGVRMQEISVLFLLLTLLLIDNYERSQKIRYLVVIPFLFYLWACLHGAFPIGLAVLFFYPILRSLENLASHKKWPVVLKYFQLSLPKKARFSGYLLLTALVSLGATMITPYGTKLIGFLSGYRDTFYLTHINEWLPQWYFPFQYAQLGFLALILTVLALSWITSRINNSSYRLRPWDTALTLIFIVLAFQSRRHFPLLFAVSAPLMLDFVSSFEASFFSSKKNDRLEKLLRIFLRTVLALCLIMVICSNFLFTKFTDKPFRAHCDDYPCEAVDFLRTHPEHSQQKLFAEYSWGGYLIWNNPERQLFIDGRLPQYPFAGHSLLEEYYEFRNEDKIADKLAQYDIGLILINPNGVEVKLNWLEKYYFSMNEEYINQQKNNLLEYLESSNDWDEIYSDDTSAIYAKNN